MIVICDDDTSCISCIKDIVNHYFTKEKKNFDLQTFDNPEKLLEFIKKNEVDLIVLDIMMPEISGFQVAEEIYRATKGDNLIFVSSEEQLVYQSLSFRPFGFVRKINLEEELTAALQRWEMRNEKRFIMISKNGSDEKILMEKIQYINSEKHYLYIHTEDKEYKIRGKMSDFQMLLDWGDFILCAKSFMVNLFYVKEVTRKMVVLRINESLPLSRTRAEECQQQFKRYVRKRI